MSFGNKFPSDFLHSNSVAYMDNVNYC